MDSCARISCILAKASTPKIFTLTASARTARSANGLPAKKNKPLVKEVPYDIVPASASGPVCERRGSLCGNVKLPLESDLTSSTGLGCRPECRDATSGELSSTKRPDCLRRVIGSASSGKLLRMP